MAYQRPAVTVIQEFVGLAPALAQFALPSCVIGPVFQLVDDDSLGSFAQQQNTYAYASLMGGASVDLEKLDPNELFPATKKPIEVSLQDALVQVVGEETDGVAQDGDFSSSAADFSNVQAGDLLVIPGGDNEGNHRIASVDGNTLVLESPLEDETSVTFEVHREVSSIPLNRVDSLPGNGFLAEEAGITLPGSLDYTDDELNTYPIVSGEVLASYRALRNDMAANVKEYFRLADVQADFGVDQITPQNPLAFALSIMLQNTTTSVHALGLNHQAMSDEVLSYTNALDILGMTEMYALVPLTQNPAIHPMMATHVSQLSQPDAAKERVAILNRRIQTVEVLKEEAETSLDEANARTIVNTQTNGAHDGDELNKLTDPDSDQFMNVEPGDTVVISGGDGVTPGSYDVAEVVDDNTLVLASDFAQSGPAATNVEYHILRLDGLGADGTTFYDRDAAFLSDGIAPGHFIEIMDPSGAIGRHQITMVESNQQVQLEQVPGVTSLVTGITYEANRDMSRSEQADFLRGYSMALGSRRVVNLWPDILKTPVGQEIEDLPGFYGCCAIGAMTTGLPTQQGFTNLTMSGFLGFDHSDGYFNDTQMDSIAGGGTMILSQNVPEAPLYVRHQLTTDLSAIKFQEFSITKNVDFIAKFVRNQYKSFIGPYNIIDTTFDELRTTANAIINFLRDSTRLPRIGGVIKGGTLAVLEEHEDQIDTVLMRFEFGIPVPLNRIRITIQV